MTVQEILKFLLDLGISPLEILSVIAIIVLYRDNRALFSRITQAEQTIIELTKRGQ